MITVVVIVVMMAVMVVPVLLRRLAVAGHAEAAPGKDAVRMRGEGTGDTWGRLRGGRVQGSAHATADPRFMLGEGIEESRHDHVAGHATQGIEVNLHHA